tara:strand:+ start:1096 stop:1776 length:681 start_codon:yes stop_codon:yes gene_type:complete
MDSEIVDRIPMLKNSRNFLGCEFLLANESPPVVMIRGLLTPWECEHLIKLAGPKLEPSTMIVKGKEVVDPNRSSRSAFLTKNGLQNEDPVINRLFNKISKMIDVPISHFEGLKVVNYRKGEQYVGHRDYFGKGTSFVKTNGDRMYTFFMYLNDLGEDEGGATAFPNIGIKIRPEAGTAMFWVNIDHKGHYYEHEVFHAGEPITGDTEKWGVNLWIREKSYPGTSEN